MQNNTCVFACRKQNVQAIGVCSCAKELGITPFTTSVFDVQPVGRSCQEKKPNEIPTVLSQHETDDLQMLQEKFSLMNLMDAHINTMQWEYTTKQM